VPGAGARLTVHSKKAAAMLKLTRLPRPGRVLTIKVDGELLGPWVGVVRDACAERGRRSGRLRLDLAAVTYADAAGAQLLRDLVRERVEIAACSSFIAELLHRED